VDASPRRFYFIPDKRRDAEDRGGTQRNSHAKDTKKRDAAHKGREGHKGKDFDTDCTD